MSGDDYGLVVGLYAAAWGTGYVAGYLLKAARRVLEAALGVGSG